MKQYLQYEDVPSLVQIETTYACNHKCTFCYNPRRDEKIDYDRLDSIVDSISKSQIPHVYLIGGEPSLIPVPKLNEYIEKLSVYSSVAIITNGAIRLKNITHKLACFGIPIHGINAEEHDASTGIKGSFNRTLDNIKYYVAHGYDVRIVLVLTGLNYNRMYEMIRMAAELGAESVYIDRYEDGGFGAQRSSMISLKPTLAQFREGISQILQAKKDFSIFNGKIGFGTAIPMCIDERMFYENITSTCGVGTSFCAVNPDGFLRICNQSEIKFGNVIDEPIEEIWKKKDLDMFRDLSWVDEPCRSCKLLEECQCGCKVDVNCSDKFCIDFAVREDKDEVLLQNIENINAGKYDDILYGEQRISYDYPEKMRVFKLSPYLKLHDRYSKKIVTRYNTIKVEDSVFQIVKDIIDNNIVNEQELIDRYADTFDADDLRKLVSELIQGEAFELIGTL